MHAARCVATMMTKCASLASRVSPPALQPYGLNDTIGCLLDCEGGTIAFSKNGQMLGPAFQLPQVGAESSTRLWWHCTAGGPGFVRSLQGRPVEPALYGQARQDEAVADHASVCPLNPQYLQGQALYPAICLKNAELAVNFGQAPFKHGPPPGYAAARASLRRRDAQHVAGIARL